MIVRAPLPVAGWWPSAGPGRSYREAGAGSKPVASCPTRRPRAPRPPVARRRRIALFEVVFRGEDVMLDNSFEPEPQAGRVLALRRGRIVLGRPRVEAAHVGVGRAAGEDRQVRQRPLLL